MLRQAPGTPRLASVKPPFLFNHPLSALWVGALQVSGSAEGYRERMPLSMGTSVLLFRLIFQTDTQEGSFLWSVVLSGDLA